MAMKFDNEAQNGSDTVISKSASQTEKENHRVVDEKVEAGHPNMKDESPWLSQVHSAGDPTSWKLLMVVVALALTMFLVALDLTIVSTAIPRITDEFHSLDQVGWYGSAYLLTLACFQSFWGKLYKFFPIKMILLISIFIFEIGSLICGVAQNSTTLIVGRAIAGWGGAGASSGAYTVIGFSAPPQKRPMLTSILAASYSVASVLGPLIGGIACLIGAVVCYILALDWGGSSKAWNSADVIGVLVGFGVFLLLFIAIQICSGDYALIQGRLLKDRSIASMCALVFFTASTYFGLLYYLPVYFQSTRGVSAQQSGIDTLALVVGSGLFSIFSAGIVTVTGHYNLIFIIGLAIVVTSTALMYTLELHTSTSKWLAYQILAGMGCGMTLNLPFIINQALVRATDISSISATTLFFTTIGGAFFVSAAEAGFVNKLLQRLPHTAPGVDPHLVASGKTELS